MSYHPQINFLPESPRPSPQQNSLRTSSSVRSFFPFHPQRFPTSLVIIISGLSKEHRPPGVGFVRFLWPSPSLFVSLCSCLPTLPPSAPPPPPSSRCEIYLFWQMRCRGATTVKTGHRLRDVAIKNKAIGNGCCRTVPIRSRVEGPAPAPPPQQQADIN